MGTALCGGFSTESTCCVIEEDLRLFFFFFLLDLKVSRSHVVHALPHPKSGLQLDLAVGSGSLQQEALVQSHVGDVEETIQRQAQRPEQRFLLVLFDLDHKNKNSDSFRAP